MGFDADIAVRDAGPGTFDVEVPAHWRVGKGGTNGGYLAAVITRALEAALADPARPPRSLTVHYLAACQAGPARVAVSVERAGRSLASLSARMTQGDAPVALALAALGQERSGIEFQHDPMPEAPPPEEVPAWPFVGGRPAFTANWEYRPCVGAMPFSRAAEAVTGGWIRPAEPRRLDAPMLAAMADSWIPPVIPLLDEPRGMLPTIDLTVHFRASTPLTRPAPDDYCFALFRSRVGARGFWESDGTIWSRRGTVLAQARQLALFGMRTT